MLRVRAFCHLYEHYEPPKGSFPTLDGDPGAYCKHPPFSQGRYLFGEMAYELNLRRAPLDWFRKFKLRKGLGPKDEFLSFKTER